MSDSPDQYDLIHDEEWDYLIIFDACRADVFEEMYPDFIQGTMGKAWSEGSHTLEWLSKTWPDYYDLDYVSGHALINSAGIRGHTMLRKKVEAIEDNDSRADSDYIPADHFDTIHDVWGWGYSHVMETVSPMSINERARSLDTDRKVVVHYVQPHFPWALGHRKEDVLPVTPSGEPRNKVSSEPTRGTPRFSRSWVAENLGPEWIEKAYRSNLALVLGSLEVILPALDGRVVITADHGEYLRGDDDHPPGSDDPILRTVPWFEVNDEH